MYFLFGFIRYFGKPKREFEGMNEISPAFKNQHFFKKSGILYLSMSIR